MYKADALAYFGTQSNIVKTLGNRTKGAISQWGSVVPLAAARQLEAKSGGDCKVNPDLYDEYGRILRAKKRAA